MRISDWSSDVCSSDLASAIEAARSNAHAIAIMLREVGINVDALPLLDVRQPGANDIIGDRALGSEPLRVAALGRAMLDGLRRGGVNGIVKHMPGHGRAMADSHRPEEHTSELQSLMRISYAAFCFKKQTNT